MSAEVADTATSVPLSDIRADDALLDALGGRDADQAAALADDDLSGLLVAWRHACDRAPASELVPTRRAVWMFRRARWTAGVSRFLNRLTRRTR